MEKGEINLISLDIKKWDLPSQRIYLKNLYLLETREIQMSMELSLTQPPDMVEEFMKKWRLDLQSKLDRDEEPATDRKIAVNNENFIRQKLHTYFQKILSELNNTKRRKGGPRMILSTHLDVYAENQDISFLLPEIQQYILLNWARRYYEKEEFQKAIGPLQRLIKIKPDFGLAYKWLARSLKKVRKYDEAVRNYELYAKIENSLDAKLDLAKSYRKGKMFEKSEKIYQNILKEYPDEREARIGLAQIKYARMEKDYLDILNDLESGNEEWLRQWLKDEFNFRIYATPKTALTPIMATRFLGLDQVSDLTQMAFRNEVPSHFNPAKARMNFFREELENWAEVANRFGLMPKEIKLLPEVLNTLNGSGEEGEEDSASKISSASRKEAPRSSRVEEIIRQIREARARREGQMQAYKATRKSKAKKGPASNKKDGSDTKSEDTAIGSGKKIRPGRKKSTEVNSGSKPADTEKKAGKETAEKRKGSKKRSARKKDLKKNDGIDLPTEKEFILEKDQS